MSLYCLLNIVILKVIMVCVIMRNAVKLNVIRKVILPRELSSPGLSYARVQTLILKIECSTDWATAAPRQASIMV